METLQCEFVTEMQEKQMERRKVLTELGKFRGCCKEPGGKNTAAACFVDFGDLSSMLAILFVFEIHRL